MFNIDDIVIHTKTNDRYVITAVPDDNKLLEYNGSTYYEYISIDDVIWIRCKEEMEDGRFIKKYPDEFFKYLMVYFMKTKDNIIFRETGIHIISRIDEIEINTWSEDVCKKFFKNMVKVLDSYGDEDIADGVICPWCFLNIFVCHSCNYGRRYDECDQWGSKYRGIRIGLNHSITSIPDIKALMNKCERIYCSIEK